MITCCNCHTRIDFMKDYEVTCIDKLGSSDTMHMCEECLQQLPVHKDGFGCDLCELRKPIFGEITIQHIRTGEIITIYTLCEECYFELLGDIYTFDLEEVLNNEHQ